MSFWLQNGHGTGEYRGLDDASVETLLRGHYQEDDPDLVAVSQFLQHVRSFADDPAPAPSAALMDVLSQSVPTPEPTRPLTSWRLRLRAGGSQPLRRRHVSAVRRHRFTPVELSSVVVAAAVAVLVAVVSSGSVRVLPGATQDVLARVVHAVTPFDFPEHSEPAAVLSESPRERSPGEDEVSGGGRGPSQVQPGQSGQNHPSSLAADRTGGGAQPSGAAAPTGTTTLPARPAPAAPESERQPASSAPTTTSRPLPGDDRISASLSRTPRRGPAQPDPRGRAVIDLRPGRDELCLTLDLSGASQVTSVQIRAGSMGGTGDSVASFTRLAAGGSPTCVSVDHELLKKIRKEPEHYYIEVHTADAPTEPLRGQLTR